MMAWYLLGNKFYYFIGDVMPTTILYFEDDITDKMSSSIGWNIRLVVNAFDMKWENVILYCLFIYFALVSPIFTYKY